MVENTNVADKLLSNLNSPHDKNFQDLIIWSKNTFHHLPWRSNRSLYSTLISEFMLQQTTVAGVRNKYIQFIETYPSWSALQTASLDDILKLWQGLGYYQRPKSLYALVQKIPSEMAFIENLRLLRKQPGIGPYTHGALLSIGLNEPAEALDANIRRVLSRYVGSSSNFQHVYRNLLTTHAPRDLNEALMDLGREVCQARKASCSQCLLKSSCSSVNRITEVLASEQSVKKTPQKIVLELARFIIINSDSQILGWPKPKNRWLSGYIELPTFRLPTSTHTHQYPEMPSTWLPHLSALPGFSTKGQITKHTLNIQNYLIPQDHPLIDAIETNMEIAEYLSLKSPWGKSSQDAILAILPN